MHPLHKPLRKFKYMKTYLSIGSKPNNMMPTTANIKIVSQIISQPERHQATYCPTPGN